MNMRRCLQVESIVATLSLSPILHRWRRGGLDLDVANLDLHVRAVHNASFAIVVACSGDIQITHEVLVLKGVVALGNTVCVQIDCGSTNTSPVAYSFHHVLCA